MKLIDKDALVAEIEKIVDVLERNSGYGIFIESQMVICEKILSFLDTLEVKDVDLEEELKTLDNTLFDLDGVAVQGGTYYLTVEDVKDIAKRFYELGLKVQRETKFESCIQEGDKIVSNEDGTHFNISQLERVSQKATDTKETAKKFLKTVGIMDKNGELADEYRFEKQDEQKPNPYTGTSFEYNGHTWGMCARDNGVEILFDGELKAFLSSDKSFIYPIHPQPDLATKNAMEAIKEEKVDNANKGEPKFKVGDWVVDTVYDKAMQILFLEDDGYEFENGIWIPYADDKERIHLWTIKDAKDGDVLVGNERDIILMFRGIGNTEWDDVIDYHCYYDYHRKDFIVQKGLEYWGNTVNNQLKPATKEQCDLLFQKIKEAGYIFDFEKKELKKIEPKFKVGDWIVTPENKVLQITSIEGASYSFNNESHYWEICYCDEKCHLWTIKDAKDGDVLCDGIDTVIYKKNIYDMIRRSMYVHCGINNKNEYWYEVGGISPIDYSPATKEQRDLLFKKMYEAGFEWDAEKKELRKIEQKSSWSDEDEYLLDETIKHLEELIIIDKSKHFGDDVQYYQRDITWLKSLKERLKGE